MILDLKKSKFSFVEEIKEFLLSQNVDDIEVSQDDLMDILTKINANEETIDEFFDWCTQNNINFITEDDVFEEVDEIPLDSQLESDLDSDYETSIEDEIFELESGNTLAQISTEEKLKLFPKTGNVLVHKIQDLLKEKTGKTIEVMVYGDGAFKDPVGKIWELADPVVSPAFTDGLIGTPNEIKLKYVADNKYASLTGNDLKKAIINEIKEKQNNLVGQNISLGTTPRRITDLVGSLCDLTSGSGDKGTPVVLIQGYFDNLSNE